MSTTRVLNKLICRVLIGVLLFAQLAVAAYACPGMGGGVVPVAMAQVQDPGDMQNGCDPMDSQAANLCAEHCKFGQQSSDTAPAPLVTAPVLALLYEVVPLVEVRLASPPPSDPAALAAAPPPHAILHCVFRI